MNIHFDGVLTAGDNKKHIPLPFDVPSGTTRLHIEFTYTPRQAEGMAYPHLISLTLFDPEGARGARHNNRDQRVTITAYEASPGYIPGPLQPGTWTVFIDTHRLMPAGPIQYQLEIALSNEPVSAPEEKSIRRHNPTRGPGWYRGDLHAHSIHSDGNWDVPDLAAFARSYGMDFVTLTDHNTVSGLAEHDGLSDDHLLTMGGMELTTYYGHALALGTRRWVEWRVDVDPRYTMHELAQRVLDSGALFVIAHPLSPGDPLCTGCRWEYQDMMPGIARVVEIWNEFWTAHNEQALQQFYRWLNAGYRLSATTGTDLHGPPPDGARYALNVVYAQELSEQAILDSIRCGHLYVSAGPDLILNGRTASGAAGMMGDVLPAETATVETNWSRGHEGDHLRLIVNGKVHHEQIVGVSGAAAWTLEGGQANWCVVELRDSDNGLWAVTNPLFFGTWGA